MSLLEFATSHTLVYTFSYASHAFFSTQKKAAAIMYLPVKQASGV